MKTDNSISSNLCASAPLRELLKFIIFSFVTGFFFVQEGNGQSSLEVLISNAKESNKTMIAAQQLYEAEIVGAKTGNSPDNPEVEYAYLWGTPDQLGDRVDLEITQSFDFPTAYTSRNKLSKINRSQAFLRLKATGQDVVVNAKQAWIMAVYFNNVTSLLERRLKNMELITNAFRRLFDEGESNQLELNQAKLKETALRNDFNKVGVEIISNNAVITQLNGGKPYGIIDTIFSVSSDIGLDSLIIWYRQGPQNVAFLGEVSRMEQQKDVAFNQKLPRLKAGYFQETILGTKMAGIRAGITIPLWGNANDVKSAKAGLVYAQSDAVRFWEIQELRVQQLYNQWEILKIQVEEMTQLLQYSNNDDLLLKALEGGEISLTQYYYESDFYFENQFDLLELQRDLHLVEAELLRVTY